MTAPPPVQDAPPGWLWRTAALAWLLVLIAVGVHQWQFWTHDGIDTDVMALLPVNEQAPDVALATAAMNAAVEAIARRDLRQYQWTYKRFTLRPPGSGEANPYHPDCR